jgi:hypothetical protein
LLQARGLDGDADVARQLLTSAQGMADTNGSGGVAREASSAITLPTA